MPATNPPAKGTGKPSPLSGLDDDKYGPLDEQKSDGPVHENPGPKGTYGGRKAYAEQALPADVDPAVPAPAEPIAVQVMREVTQAKENRDNYKFVKEQFFSGPASSKRPTLTELHNARDAGAMVLHERPDVVKDATAHDIVIEILHRAGIQHDHPELILPFAQALEGIDYDSLPIQ